MSQQIDPAPAPPEPTTTEQACESSVFDDASVESEYQDARRFLLQPPAFQQKTLLLLGTLGLFVIASARNSGLNDAKSLQQLAIILGVLFFHELGHYVGMRLFGYRDVRMFFIPFFGAAVMGKRRGVARWKQAVVLLLGPLPGIFVGIALLVGAATSPFIVNLASTLLVVNGLNLLPVAPLDGGQLFQVLLFSRRRYLELGFIAIAGGLLVAGGLYSHIWVFAIIGYVLLVGLRYRWRVLRAAYELRRAEPTLPVDPAALDDTQCRALFGSACSAVPRQWRRKPRREALAMEEILERATLRPPSMGASLALLGGWASGAVALLVGFALVFLALPPQWRDYSSPVAGFHVEFPASPVEKLSEGSRGTVFAQRGLNHAYVVSWIALPDDGRAAHSWLLKRRDDLLGQDQGGARPLVVREEPLATDASELRLAYRAGSGALHDVRIVIAGARLFTVLAAAPGEEPDSRRFLDSFAAE